MANDDTAILREVRAEYFKRNGLGPDGGYSADWVRFRFGPITLPLPNTSARRRALPPHDLHHIATGYDTSWKGEAEIAAWELASGCGRYVAAWMLNFSAFAIGLVIAPQRTWRAFRRGRTSASLYAERWDERWLDSTLGALRQRLQIGRTRRTSIVGDAILFVGCAIPELAIVAVLVAIVVWLVRALVS
ncbi:MAG TPA: hypothetical protein VGQ52_10730 [Gemmatimonadaceae bacterium]|jgi:hypothetical protein|nr:hypothetical protein [Gemmatimonadaceae bacterium]